NSHWSHDLDLPARLSTTQPRRLLALLVHFADGVDQGLRLIELYIFRAIAGKDLLSVRRQSEPARLGQRGLLLIFEVLRRVRRLSFQMADTVVSGGQHSYRPGAE